MADAPEFVHLRLHTQYSLLSSPLRIAEAVKAATADGQRALALTDSGNLFGAIEFYQACRGAEIKPILGMTAFVAGKSRLEPTGTDNPTFQLSLLAADARGWDNLRRLSSLAFLEGFHYRPRVDLELLARHSAGLIALSGGMQGEVQQHLMAGRQVEATRVAGRLRELFGRESFYLELMETGYAPQRQANAALRALAETLDSPVVATNDVHYLTAEDWIVQDIMLCIRNGHVVSNPDRFRMGSRELFFKSRVRMAQDFADCPQALAATVAIAERCDVAIDFETYHLPVFDTASSETPDEVFERLCRAGARERYGEVDGVVQDRLAYEMGVIRKLGFVSYFLVVQDFIRHARGAGIPVGPGRGSAAGSLVSYALGITDVDPLKYNLIFERFLNAERVSMPDIDIDFCGNRRDEVIEYVRGKYGSDNVCQIITFGTMASRGVLRDVGRVLELPLDEVDRIAKKVPQGPGASLKVALDSDAELQAIRKSSAAHARVFDLGLKLEGLVRHSSVHAAGVVIADRPLIDYVPLARNGDDVTTQWQMTELEQVGLLKMDFLGLKTLTLLQEGAALVRRCRGVSLDLDRVPLDDAQTYRLMTAGDTLGVFQLESQGMRELLMRLVPDTFEDVIAALALYRPGPLGSGMVDMFVRRKHRQESVEYPHASLQPILEETYGVIVYQEQVMRIANVLAGFSMTEADNLRKAMGKKKPEVMAKYKERFVSGAVEQGHAPAFARQLFETMEYFAGYGFNKSHSAAYALVTFQTAYLKAHYPVEFFAANLTVESGNSDKVREFVEAARRAGIELLPPDVNRSSRFFDVEGPAIRFGLGAIKGIGTKAADSVAAERERSGTYASLDDFCERVDPAFVNKAAMEALAKAGAFDGLGPSRQQAFAAIDAAMRASAAARADRRRGQRLLFGAPDATEAPPAAPATVSEWPEHERLACEKEALGFYLSGHPFEKRGRFFARIAGHTSATIRRLDKDTGAKTEVRLAGMLVGIRVVQIKSGRNAGQKMAKFTLEDLEGSVPVTCFARTYQDFKDAISEDAIVFVRGRVDAQGEDGAILADEVVAAQNVVDREVDGVVLSVTADATSDRILERILGVVQRFPGKQRLQFDVDEGGQVVRVRADARFSVHVTDALLDGLAEIVGPESLSFTRA
jgi:DNA polymerase-3 subunit alpha